jgi:hypothetical protein
MKKANGILIFLLSVMLCMTLAMDPNAYADPISVNDIIRLYDGPGTTNGGEFRVYHNGDYQFNTFCLERDEYFSFGQNLTVVGISDSAIQGGVGPGGDPIRPMTAYLFTQFSSGTYSLYDYGAGRDASANAMQLAIWFIEGESTQSLTGLALAFYNDALLAGWQGIGNVRVLNLINASNGLAQDQLVMVPEPSTLLLLGAGLLGLGILGRKKFKTKP